jgi:hypothetical protein
MRWSSVWFARPILASKFDQYLFVRELAWTDTFLVGEEMRYFTALALAIMAAPATANAETLDEYVAQTGAVAFYTGQSFTISAPGNYDHISFNFFWGGGQVAPGTLYLFESAYTGTPTGLASAVSGLVGSAIGAGNVYSFAPSLTLAGGTKYFAYAGTAANLDAGNPGSYAGGEFYYSGDGPLAFAAYPSIDVAFRVTGSAVAPAIPEPASWALMLGGFMLAGIGMRRRRPRVHFA